MVCSNHTDYIRKMNEVEMVKQILVMFTEIMIVSDDFVL